MATSVTMSGAQFDALPYEEGRRWELLDGELIEVSGPTPIHQRIVRELLRVIQSFLETSGPEGSALPDVEFAFSDNSRLRPDVCVLLEPKASELDPYRIPAACVPDLATEIISPSERASDSNEKVRAYLRNGVAEVWQLYPKSRMMYVHTQNGTHAFEGHQLIASDLLPGLSEPVSRFFV